MAADDTSKLVFEELPMEGGDGPNSYAKNSTFQVSSSLLLQYIV